VTAGMALPSRAGFERRYKLCRALY